MISRCTISWWSDGHRKCQALQRSRWEIISVVAVVVVECEMAVAHPGGYFLCHCPRLILKISVLHLAFILGDPSLKIFLFLQLLNLENTPNNAGFSLSLWCPTFRINAFCEKSQNWVVSPFVSPFSNIYIFLWIKFTIKKFIMVSYG